MARHVRRGGKAGRGAAKRRGPGQTVRTGGVVEALPALSSLSNVPAFSELRCSAAQRAAFDECCRKLEDGGEALPEELQPGCVVRLDRGFPAVVTHDGVARAEFAAQLTKGDYSRVAVGDWVCVRCPADHDMWLIEGILPRESDIARWRGKARGERQTLAANVDLVLVAQAVGERPVSCDRIARSAVIARDCGAQYAVVLTKADRAGDEDLRGDVRALREVLGGEVPIALTSSVAERAAAEGSTHGEAVAQAARLSSLCDELHVLWGTDGVRELVGPGTVAIVLGESGAGKSTLLNALLRQDLLRTGAVRTSDDAGRHTTVSRRMVSLPGAGIIVDEPGLRSLPLVGHERGLAKVFPDIAEAAVRCRFRDCTHTHEPGCAVRAGLVDGAFPRERVEVYVALAAEMRASAASLDPDVVL